MAGPNKKTSEEADAPTLTGAVGEYLRITVSGSSYRVATSVFKAFVLGDTGTNTIMQLPRDQNGRTTATVANTDAGTGAYANWSINNGTNGGEFRHNGTGFTTSGMQRQAGTNVTGNGGGGLSLFTTANQPVYFGVNSTEVAKFDTTPALDLVCGKLKFPASQSASADANTLDDYEEGTFTPAFTASGVSGVTYATQSGYYTKVGREVYIEMRLTLTSKGSGGSGVATVTGLPFTVADRSAVFSAIYDFLNLNTGLTSAQGSANSAGTSISMVELGDNVAAAGITWANYANNTDLNLTGHYHA